MHVDNLWQVAEFNPNHHVEKILKSTGDGDVTVAAWEPGQVSPFHCHPSATEIYFCLQGGGQMRTLEDTVDIVPGAFVLHPAGEVHEYINGDARTLLLRVRYGSDMQSRHLMNRGKKDWKQSKDDEAYFEARGIRI